MKTKWIATATVLLVAACGRGELDQIVYENQVFFGDISSSREDRAAFVATGGPAAVSLEGSRQVAVFKATQYCLDYLGSSDVAWTNGPDVEDTALVIQDGEVVLSGRCDEP